MPLSAAAVLDQVRAGASLASIAGGVAMDDIVDAVLEAKCSLRYGVVALDDDGLRRRAGIEPWSIAEIVGHALASDVAAHRVARALALGRAADPPPLGEAGPADAGREALLAGIRAAEERAAEARVLAAGGPTLAHPHLGELDARGWILSIAVHDAVHLHQAAAVARAPR